MRAPSRKALVRGSILLALVGLAAVVPALVQSGSEAAAAPAVPGVADAETINLCADEGTINLPGLADPVPIWGFSLANSLTLECDADASLPGPELGVDVGDTVTVNLQNNLAEEDVSIVFPGQNLVPNAVVVPAGDSGSYTFTASKPGTYLYEAGTNTSVQVPMGLYGALAVRPLAAGQAYGATTTYDVEKVLVLSEIDLNLNNLPDPNDFNFVGDDPTDFTDGYLATYFLINGEAYTPTASPITAGAGDDVLLRYVNAGIMHHTMTLLGDHQSVIAKDAFPTGANRYDAVAETIPAGSTLDAIVSAGAAGSYPLYSRNLDVTNNGSYPGGMLTFLALS